MLRSFAAFASTLAMSAALLQPTAALAVQPESGMWNLAGEVTGKPGRGLQIDSQGGQYLIVTYFGYREDGSSMFLQASGPKQENGTFVGDLVEFEGGRALGAPAKDGQARRVVGSISLAFDSATSGSVTLPGEQATQIQRFQYENPVARFTQEGRFSIAYSIGSFGVLSNATVTFKLEGTSFFMRKTGSETSETCEYTGAYQLAGQGIRAEGTYSCASQIGSSNGTFRTEQMAVNDQGSYGAVIWRSPSGGSTQDVPEYQFGICQAPVVMLTPSRCRMQ